MRLPRLEQDLADRLVAEAREAGGVGALTGPDGLLSGLVAQVLETALSVELADHLGYEPHERRPSDSTNARNGTTPKTVQTDVGPVRVDVPRDRDGSFDPIVVPKHARRLSGFDEQVMSLYSKGFTTGDIVEHVEEIYGSQVSKDLVSRVTDAVVGELVEWQNRPLDEVYAVIFIDVLYVKIRDGQVSNRPIYVAMGINLAGERDVLGIWAGDGGEGAKQWGSYLIELRNRGVQDVMIVCCDGLTGLPEAINSVWPLAQVQTCVVHLIRNSCKYVSRADRKAVCGDLRKVYTAPTLDAAEARWLEFDDTWGVKYPAVVGVWERAWEEFIPFLAHPPELRRIMYTTNAIESLNARFRHAVNRRGHFPTEQAAMKVLYLCVKRKQKNRSNPTGKVVGWGQILNALVVAYGDRITRAIK
ncbi:MAG: IS256 family transposase [bacterium]|nr:IS256 family transposase [bacterium]